MSGRVEDAYSRAGVFISWDPESRVLRCSYGPASRPAPEQAREVQDWMNERIGPSAPFGMLVDLANTDALTIAWRYRWVSWFYSQRGRVRVALINTETVARTVVDAFRLSTRTEVRSFPNEAAAQAWLFAAGKGPSTARSL